MFYLKENGFIMLQYPSHFDESSPFMWAMPISCPNTVNAAVISILAYLYQQQHINRLINDIKLKNQMPIARFFVATVDRNVDDRVEVEFLSVGIRDIAVGRKSSFFSFWWCAGLGGICNFSDFSFLWSTMFAKDEFVVLRLRSVSLSFFTLLPILLPTF